MDFGRSDPAARLVLVEGMVDLLQTLVQRGLPVADTCRPTAAGGGGGGVIGRGFWAAELCCQHLHVV